MAITSGSSPDPKLMAALNALAAGSGGTGLGSGRVYMGEYASYRAPKGASPQSRKNIMELSSREAGRGHTGSIWLSTDVAGQDYYNWAKKKQQDFVSQGVLSGMLKLGDGPMEGAALWKKLVKEAANYGAVGKKVTPYDLMASYVQASGGAGAWVQRGAFDVNTQTGQMRFTGPGTYLGGGKARQTDTRVDLTDPDTAHAISTKMFQDLMGRDPGQGELSAFANALHSAEQNSPVVSTTTTQYDMDTGQAISSDTAQSGGLTADSKAYMQEQKIKKTKEYGAYQAATTYENALENLVFGSPE